MAAVINFLAWLWISSIAILLGVEFNAEGQRQRLVEAGMPENVEPFFVDLRATAKPDDPEKERVAHAQRVRREHVRS